ARAAVEGVEAGVARQRVVAGQAPDQVGNAGAGFAVGAGGAVGRRRGRYHRIEVEGDAAIGQQAIEVRAYALQHSHVDEGGAAHGAVRIYPDGCATIGRYRLDEIARGKGKVAEEEAGKV